ncbi:AraC family transcriptional regulator [Herbaspirillum robiniae]|uniref:AraC family transcriptional regulator n=1 Tax=Herbaspirillum robiniae TaxID=2014887 RepID=A0ABX2LWS4_9BURK|nr:AraC family transcriptional regulator [Herbaspirillum robiniae]NUU00009.1 AraC family transcriptional regulator [Herbaspirillum robiniae]
MIKRAHASEDSASSRTADLLAALAPDEGYNMTSLAELRVLRAGRPQPRMPVLHGPGILLVAQGRKRDYLADEASESDAQHYRMLTLTLPFVCEIEATEDEPLLAAHLRLDPVLMTELLRETDPRGAELPAPQARIAATMDEHMRTSLQRLLEVAGDATESRVLGRSLLREIFFRALNGAQGPLLRASLIGKGRFGDVARALRLMVARHMQPLTVARMAKEADMSVPVFHVHFRTATGSSPLQYLKAIRLHRARMLMQRYGLSAVSASGQVGYESAPQFNREFKRMFGMPPAEELQRIKRGGFALQPEEEIFIPS